MSTDSTFERQMALYLDQFRKGLITHAEYVTVVAGAVAEEVGTDTPECPSYWHRGAVR